MSGFLVSENECDQCLFSRDRIVSPARMKDVLATCRRNDTFFECHKGTIEGRHVCCRGWFERFSCNLSRIAERLGAVRFVDPETGKPSCATTDAQAAVSKHFYPLAPGGHTRSQQ